MMNSDLDLPPTDELADGDITHLVEIHETIEAIKTGEKYVADPPTELEGHRMAYSETFAEAILADDIISVEVVADPEEYPSHPVRVKTDRFDIVGKFGDEKHDSTDEVAFVMCEHRQTGLSHNEVNNDITGMVTKQLA